MSTTTTQLTQEEKRIKIAEACGWRYFDDPCTRITWLYGPNNRMRPKAELLKDSPAAGRQLFIADEFSLPNYFEDLNACHEMENALDRNSKRGKYCEILELLTGIPHMRPFNIVHATASMKAEAFGAAMDLWTIYVSGPRIC